uniref:Uncharacterized protein n=1 Tax=Quercus lobata TaxID=97700 RepID=A0A7N2KQD1_QUELO
MSVLQIWVCCDYSCQAGAIRIFPGGHGSIDKKSKVELFHKYFSGRTFALNRTHDNGFEESKRKFAFLTSLQVLVVVVFDAFDLIEIWPNLARFASGERSPVWSVGLNFSCEDMPTDRLDSVSENENPPPTITDGRSGKFRSGSDDLSG